MRSERLTSIKVAQKEALLFKELSKHLLLLSQDEPELQKFFMTRVQLSSNKSVCIIYFYAPDGEEVFNKLAGKLILYKPSLRKAIARTIPARYTPDLVFKFDEQFEKQQRIEHLLDEIKEESS